jgi:hypothetical protein
MEFATDGSRVALPCDEERCPTGSALPIRAMWERLLRVTGPSFRLLVPPPNPRLDLLKLVLAPDARGVDDVFVVPRSWFSLHAPQQW